MTSIFRLSEFSKESRYMNTINNLLPSIFTLSEFSKESMNMNTLKRWELADSVESFLIEYTQSAIVHLLKFDFLSNRYCSVRWQALKQMCCGQA
jgi:hypothetical protein